MKRQDVITERGFTLLEVMIALLILAMSLTVLLSSQSASMAAAGRSRDITLAALLARSKMIDIEQKLIHDGFTTGTVEDSGDFKDEGEAKAKWQYRVTEIELDLSLITDLCEGYNKDKSGSSAPISSASANTDPCTTMASTMSTQFQQLATSVGQAMRVVDLTVTIPNGGVAKNSGEKVDLRTIVMREDMNVQSSSGTSTSDSTSGSATTSTTTGTTDSTGTTTQ